MNKFIAIIATLLSFSYFLSSCGSDDNDKSQPSIEGKWIVNDRFLTSDKDDETSKAFTESINKWLKVNAKEDYKIEKNYRKRGETEERGLVGDILTEYTPLKEGYPTPISLTNEFEFKNDSIIIYEDNLKTAGYCNVGEKILIIRRKVTEAELEPILISIGISNEIPEGYTGTYTTYEMR